MIQLLKKRLAAKVILTILVVCLIPTVFNSVFFYHSASDVVKENVRESSRQIARQAAESLSFIFSNGSDMSDLIYSNERIQEIVKDDLDNRSSGTEGNQEYMTSYLNSNIYTSSFVRIIYVLKEDGMSWGSGTFSPYKLSKVNIDRMDWAKEAVRRDGELVWGGLQYDRFSGAGENTDLVLPITRVLKDFDTMENIAYIQVSLDGKAILDKINQVKLGKTGHFFVVNEQAEVVIDNDLETLHKPVQNKEMREYILSDKREFEFEEDDIPYYGVTEPIGNGWLIVGRVPTSEITGEIISIQKIIIGASIIFGILAILVGSFIAKKVTDPVKILTEQMKLVGEGNLKVRTSVDSKDEIGMMSSEFNHMIYRVEDLLEQVKEEQHQKQEAVLRAIKHRINPHFLFNTLSTIRWLVQFKETERANTALTALSKLLEGNMGKTGNFISIKEEVELVEQFMVILQIRYEQKFHLVTDFEEGVEGWEIPRMLLQPIVENAIFHGIVPTGTEGTVWITGKNIPGGIQIEIRDDGVGVEQDMLQRVQRSSVGDNSYVGIGLSHVADSIRLYFGPDSKLEISSGEGTVVKLVLMTKTGGDQGV
ncbi:sensor histidine kinase [Rossellomorea aquimaris]|uniref:HAMP domain-containing protein n=1 Tax=Rossellomorea aquimaris TaxID=189382 RepID=A0A5D4U361_9BACI|nr:sensor histidine kinase [Rossellomorea aquimaris]TYS81698.1 HAMP domain-containing protein [Rossellomorea aquimaris]TYS88323.1 HAMP domain-containing protein [Rossellomorea aquimaris]